MQKTVVLWNRDTKDYRMKLAADIRAWCACYSPNAGDIVLMHDDRPFAVTAVEAFCIFTQFDHSSFRTVSELTGKQPTLV